jgi:hypothetical protein
MLDGEASCVLPLSSPCLISTPKLSSDAAKSERRRVHDLNLPVQRSLHGREIAVTLGCEAYKCFAENCSPSSSLHIQSSSYQNLVFCLLCSKTKNEIEDPMFASSLLLSHSIVAPVCSKTAGSRS